MEWLKKNLAKPEIQYRPELRWWLAEGFHTDETLKKDIDLIHGTGFGAIEFLAMDEHGTDHSRYGWGSEEWVHDSRLILSEAAGRRLGVSFTSGTNWATANLVTILPDDKSASKELNFSFETIGPGQSRRGPLNRVEIPQSSVRDLVFVAVTAGKRLSRTDLGAVLDKESLVVLTDKVKEGCLEWTAPDDGIYELLTFWLHGTGQTSTPAKGLAYTVNYMDRYGVDALTDYWDKAVLTPELRALIKENGRVQMYMDSLELVTYGNGGQFWGYTLLDEFKKRRGYDLTSYLPYIVRPNKRMTIGPRTYYYDSPDSEFNEKLRNDLCQVQTELYQDNMLKPFREWLHKAGMTLRAEVSYGMPFEISLPGRYVDGIETESLEFASQPESFRHFSGLAFLFNKPYSSETGAARHNYMLPLNFYNQMIFTQFACGVSRTVLHGYSSIAGADSSTYWPGHEGMLPIYSERFNCRQPAWRHYNDWTDMLARFQMILRRGVPKRDILMLRLDYYFNNLVPFISGISEKVMYETMYLRGHEGLYWRDMDLQDSGYSWDYAAPQLLEEPGVDVEDCEINPQGPGYRALIIYQEGLPLSSAKKILQWAKKGLKIILVNGVTEMIRNEIYVTHRKAACKTPYHDNLDGELEKVIEELKKEPAVRVLDDQKETLKTLVQMGIKPRAGFEEPNAKILTFMREDEKTKYVYVYHYMYTDNKALRTAESPAAENGPLSFKLRVEGEGVSYLVDCWQNKIEGLGCYGYRDGYTEVPLTVAPGEALVVAIEKDKKEFHAVESNGYQVRKIDGKPALKVFSSGKYTVELNDGRTEEKELTVPETIDLEEWELIVEDWNEGEKKVIEEDRGLGYVTKEVYYETKKTTINIGKTKLKSWREIEGVGPEVSGIGYYTVKFRLPESYGEKNGAVLKIGSTCGNSAAVYVNGKKTSGIDYARLETDISDLLSEGENTIKVEVSSTLNNRLVARHYFDTIIDRHGPLIHGKPRIVPFAVQDYGMIGKVSVRFYTLIEVH
jgi:hypothetical protein